MRFLIQTLRAPFPDVPLGPPGQELAPFIPSGVGWRQLNYGQGEGQAEIGGCEWGFYYTDYADQHVVQLHVGKCPAAAAFDLVQRIGETTCRDTPVEILLQETDEPHEPFGIEP